MSIPRNIKQLLVFLFYNVHTLTHSELKPIIKKIMNSISITNESYIRTYILTLLFHTRNAHYGGLHKRNASYDLLFIIYKYYPIDILNIIELYIYYGSFKDLNSIIRYSSYHPKYSAITDKCYEIYIKYLIIDYYKTKYIVEHKGTCVFISDCVLHIPKENKNLDKATNATHEIVKRLYPALYNTHKHSALKKFRKIYQTILKVRTQSIQSLKNNSNIYEDISFTPISGKVYNILFDSIPDIDMRHHLSRNFLSNYRLYIIDYVWFTHNKKYNYNANMYSMKHTNIDTIQYMLSYYNAHIDYFWNTLELAFNQECYKSISNHIHT